MGLIRFLLAFSVIIAHSAPIMGYEMVDAEVAVQTFFIISGFYMFLILNEKYIGENDSYKLFITNRFLRIYPAYYAVLGCILFYSVFVLPNVDLNPPISNKLSAYTCYFPLFSWAQRIFVIFGQLFIFGQPELLLFDIHPFEGYFILNNEYHITGPLLLNGPAWSLGLELTFYLIVPFLARKKLKIIALLILLSFGVRILMALNGYYLYSWSYRFFPSELAIFLLGGVSYHFYLYIKTRHWSKSFLKGVYIGSLLLILTFSYYFQSEWVRWPFYLFIVLVIPFVFKYYSASRIDKFLGDHSYGIYISHAFFIYAFPVLGLAKSALSLLLFSMLFSMGFYYLFDRNIDKFRQQRLARN